MNERLSAPRRVGRAAADAAVLALTAGLLGWLFSLSYFPHTDEATAFREMYDYLTLGDLSTGLNAPGAWLRFDNLTLWAGYALRGFSQQGLAAAFAVANAVCWIPALYLAVCRDGGGKKNWWLAALFLFIFIPDLADGAINSYWCRYHRAPVLALLLVLVFAELWADGAPEVRRRRRRLCAAASAAVLLFGALSAGDAALLAVFAVLPLSAYFLILWWQDRARRWRVYVAGLAAAAALLAVKALNTIWLGRTGAELISFAGYGSYLRWAEPLDMLKGVLAYFKITADCWNASIPETQFASPDSVLQLLRLLMSLAAALIPLTLFVRALRKGIRTLHPVDAVASLAVLCDMAVNVLAYNNAETYRYYSAAYFLLAVLLCRAAGRWMERKTLTPERTVSRRRATLERCLFAAAFLLLAGATLEIPGEDAVEERTAALFGSRYEACADYIGRSGLENGIGGFFPSAMVDVALEGRSSLNGMAATDEGLVEVFDAPCAFGEGSARYDYIVCDTLGYLQSGFQEADVLAWYGEPADRFSDGGDLQVFVYDYDVRWRPQTVTDGVDELRLSLPLGTSRLTWTGTGLTDAEVTAEGAADWRVTERSDTALSVELDCACPAAVTLRLAGGSAEAVAFRVVRAAWELDGAVSAPTAGTYVVTLRGEAVGGAELSATADGAALSAERTADGPDRCVWTIEVPEGAAEVLVSSPTGGSLTWEQTETDRAAAVAGVFAARGNG